MRRFYILLLVVVLLVSFIAAAVSESTLVGGADLGDIKKVGDKVVLATDIEATYLGKNLKGEDEYRAVIGEPKYLNDLTTPINCQWVYDAQAEAWTMPDNFYEATVGSLGVTIHYEGKIMFWFPHVYIDGKEVVPVSIYADRLPVDPVNENYAGNTLRWQYSGFTRYLRAIEGMLIEYYIVDKLPAGDIEIQNRINKSADYTFDRPIRVYDADYKPVACTSVDGDVLITHEAMKSAVFPITIDPDSSFTTTDSDGWLDGGNTLYATLRTNAEAADVYDGANGLTIGQLSEGVGDDYLRRAYVFFDTSGLADDCVVTAGSLELYGAVDQSEIDFNLVIQEGMDTYPHDPLVVGDWDYTNYDYGGGNGGSLSTSGFTTAGYNSITLNADGRSWVNRTGYTKFLITTSLDIAGTAPPGAPGWEWEQVTIWTYEKGVGYRPTLEVTYTTGNPAVTTDAASNIAATTARLNGTVDDDGGGDVTIRFGWGETSESAIVDYDSYDTVAGTFNTGEHPYLDVASLSINTLYYFRVEGTNAYGADLGDELSFTTENVVGDPTNFVGIPTDTTVSLTWTKGTGASNSVVRYGTSTYPVIPGGGFAVYSGTSSSTVHSGLTGGTTYYYAVWGESGGDHSSNNATLMVTTSATVTGGEDFETPISPSRWLSAPDYTNLSGLLFLYDGINGSADSIGMPRETLWMVLAMALSLGMAILVYMVTKGNLFIGIIALTAGLVFGWIIQIVPFWIPLLSGIIIGAYAIGHREVKTY